MQVQTIVFSQIHIKIERHLCEVPSPFVTESYGSNRNCKGEVRMSETNNQVQSGQAQLDVLKQLSNPEVQQSLTVIIEHLPQLAEMVKLLSNSYDVAKSFATDEVFKSDTVAAITEMSEPIVHGTKSVVANIIEANDRAEASDETISAFGLLKMLKDPQVQHVLRFANEFLKVNAEQKNLK